VVELIYKRTINHPAPPLTTQPAIGDARV